MLEARPRTGPADPIFCLLAHRSPPTSCGCPSKESRESVSDFSTTALWPGRDRGSRTPFPRNRAHRAVGRGRLTGKASGPAVVGAGALVSPRPSGSASSRPMPSRSRSMISAKSGGPRLRLTSHRGREVAACLASVETEWYQRIRREDAFCPGASYDRGRDSIGRPASAS